MKSNKHRPHQTDVRESSFSERKGYTPERMIVSKIIMLGDAAVGKTSLVNRFVHRTFKGSYRATLGLDLMFRDILIPGKGTVRLQIWDVAGQTQFRTMRKRFYAGTAGAVIVFDVTRPNTFQNLNYWVEELQENIGDIPIAMVGNKADMIGMIATDEEKENSWATKNQAVIYLRTSAKTGENVDDVFEVLANEVLQTLEKLNPSAPRRKIP
ncbi:MAG: Rab family GTPase [Candidatus Hodarchaeota archaeon]